MKEPFPRLGIAPPVDLQFVDYCGVHVGDCVAVSLCHRGPPLLEVEFHDTYTHCGVLAGEFGHFRHHTHQPVLLSSCEISLSEGSSPSGVMTPTPPLPEGEEREGPLGLGRVGELVKQMSASKASRLSSLFPSSQEFPSPSTPSSTRQVLRSSQRLEF
ncbi:hypothetical protein Efla_001884 [Eimeria flavescens]